MRNKAALDTGLLFLTIGGAFMGILGIKVFVDKFIELPDIVYASVFIIVILLILAGLYFIGLHFYAIRSRSLIEFDVRNLELDELPAIRQYCRDNFGEEVADVRTFRNFYLRNKNIFKRVDKIVVNGFNKKSVMIGFYDIIPINEKAVELLNKGEIKGASILPEHVVDPNLTPHSIYIGGIVAKGFREKGSTLAFLKQDVQRYIDKGIHVLYTRPVTKIGLRLVLNYGFEPLYEETSDGLYNVYKKVL